MAGESNRTTTEREFEAAKKGACFITNHRSEIDATEAKIVIKIKIKITR